MVTGFLGPNGAGKTTTMRCILGLDYPDAGTIAVDGRDYHDLGYPMREVGALLDAKAVHGGRSAYNHLLCLAQTNNLPKRRVGEVLELVGLSEVAKKRSKGFSLGMSQRLGIAATLLGDPRVLMFDEPVNGLGSAAAPKQHATRPVAPQPAHPAWNSRTPAAQPIGPIVMAVPLLSTRSPQDLHLVSTPDT